MVTDVRGLNRPSRWCVAARAEAFFGVPKNATGSFDRDASSRRPGMPALDVLEGCP